MSNDKKYINYKYSSEEVEISDVLPLEGVNQTAFFDMIAEARKTAMKENIKANSIILNEKFAKVNPHLFNFCGAVFELPAMICGLECSYISDEFPDDFAFAVLERRKTEREWLIEKTKNDTAREIWNDCIDEIMRGCGDDKEFWVIKILIETFKKYGVDLWE